MNHIFTFNNFIREKFSETNPHGGEFNYGNLSKEDIEKVKLYIEHLKKITQENNIKLLLSPDTGISMDGIMVNGYFDDIKRILACSLGKDISQWLPILVHESCHMDQYLEQIPEWLENAGVDNIGSMYYIDKWLNGDDNVDMKLVDREIETSMAVELDNEKRSVEKTKEWGFDKVINLDEYVQNANSYVLFYLWMRKNRRWYTIGKEPYNNKIIISKMSNSFDYDYTKLPEDIEKLYDKYL